MVKQHTLTVDFGNGVRAGTGTNVRILDYDGLESLPTQGNVIEHAILDGGYVASVRSNTRRLTWGLDFGDLVGWADVSRLFPQGVVLPLTIERDGVVRHVTAKRVDPLQRLGGGGVLDNVAMQIPLVCPNPYFLGEEVVLETAADSGLEYPISFEPHIVMDQVNFEADSETFYTENVGDHPVGFLFDYAAFSGGDLVLSVGAETMTIADLQPGDRLLVDTVRRTITINDQNGFASLASGKFPRLPLGDVIINVAGTVGRSTLTFTPVFEAV